MNKKARNLGMNKTTYANSHGLSNSLNKSCAFDLCILCEHAMLNDKFKKIVSTVEFQCTITYEIVTE
jgi:D-alanyl-D-alanine carboxypeptidase (penicillin-binding protein 5/6)